MKAIVTGANGFIGTYLVNKLVSEGIEVLAVSRKFDNSLMINSNKITKLELDVKDIKVLEYRNCHGEYDFFYHFAWTGISGEARTNETLQTDNVLMTVECLKTAAKIGCKKFICAGTIMEYESMHATYEDISHSALSNIYSASKVFTHSICKSIANSLGIEFIWGYITNAYGVGEVSLRFINTTLTKIINREDLNFTSATQNYDFVYVSDVAKAFYLMGLYGINNKCYMIGSGNAKPLKEFIFDICKMFPEAKEPKFGNVPFKGINLPIDIYSIKELEYDCKFTCDVPFEKGIKMTKDWLGGGYRHSQFKAQGTSLKDVLIITPFSVDDKRGNFTKDFFRNFFKENQMDYDLSETFYAKNVKPYTLRGMHFATKNPQAKIVKCITGEIYDVIVDMRRDSPTYLKWEGFTLSEDNNLSLYVPKGFAHGYLTIKPGVVSYKCCGNYDPKYDTGIKYDDPTFNIKWPINNKNDIIISDKDNNLKSYLEMKHKIEY